MRSIRSFIQTLRKIVQQIVRSLQQPKNGAAKKRYKKRGKKIDPYFKEARSWADDLYTSTLVSRQRYKVAFVLTMILAVMLVFCIMVMVPLQRTALVVVHQASSGYVWLSTTKRGYQPAPNWQRTRAEIAHYVVARESYDPMLYSHQTKLVKLMSSSTIFGQYELQQASSNKGAPINLLGTKGYRSVTVHNVLPIDSQHLNTSKTHRHHVNLAQVNFTVNDHLFDGSSVVTSSYTVLVSWTYTGVPSNPQAMLQDWDGFTVTKYVSEPVSTGVSNKPH